MIAKLVITRGNSSVVVAKVNGLSQAYVVDSDSLKHLDRGNVELSEEAIGNATPYGIDWDMVYPDGIVISSSEIQEAMYARRIISLQDLKKRSGEIQSILISILRSESAKIYNRVKIVMEDYNDNV